MSKQQDESSSARLQLELDLAIDQIRQLEFYKRWTEEYQATRLFRYSKGLRRTYARAQKVLKRNHTQSIVDVRDSYGDWTTRYEPMIEHFTCATANALSEKPLISVLMPTFNTPVEFLSAAIDSVKNQTYENWELCVADDCSTSDETISYLRQLSHPKIKVAFRSENGHISMASNTALASASGQWVALLDHDDLIAPHALAAMVIAASEHPEASLIYSDRDLFDSVKGRFEPFFKPDFDPDLLLAMNYLCHFQMMPRELVEGLGGFRSGFEGSQDWDLSLRIVEQSRPAQVVHVPMVLYHWRYHDNSVATTLDAKPYALRAATQALEEHLKNTNRRGSIEPIENGGWFNVDWTMPDPQPSVSVLLVSYEHAIRQDDRLRLIDSIGMKTTQLEVQEIVLQVGDNRSRAINASIRELTSDYVCVIDSRLTSFSENWLSRLLSLCSQPDVGIVGPLIATAQDKSVHTGVVMGLDDCFGELYQGTPVSWHGAYGRLLVARDFSAVSLSCMMIRREAWDAAQGLNDEALPDYGSDVDLCLRLSELGFRTIWTPHVKLSFADPTPTKSINPAAREGVEQYLREQWPRQILSDPFFNVNLDLDSNNDGFCVANPPRIIDFFRLGRVTNQ
jgi:O-antigen biosynthesis protein